MSRPGVASGTGVYEDGGLSSRELLALLRCLGGLNLVGGDVIVVAPAYDHAQITTLAAATVLYDLVSLMANGRSTTVTSSTRARPRPPARPQR